MSYTIPIHEEWTCARCTLFNPASSVICVVCGETQPLPEQTISRPERHRRNRPREKHSGDLQPVSPAALVAQQPYNSPCDILGRKRIRCSHAFMDFFLQMLTALPLCSPSSSCIRNFLARGPVTGEAQANWEHQQSASTHVWVKCKHLTQSYRLVRSRELSCRRAMQ